jgi:hypothetical protein
MVSCYITKELGISSDNWEGIEGDSAVSVDLDSDVASLTPSSTP